MVHLYLSRVYSIAGRWKAGWILQLSSNQFGIETNVSWVVWSHRFAYRGRGLLGSQRGLQMAGHAVLPHQQGTFLSLIPVCSTNNLPDAQKYNDSVLLLMCVYIISLHRFTVDERRGSSAFQPPRKGMTSWRIFGKTVVHIGHFKVWNAN